MLIFQSKNEAGVPAIQQVQTRHKTVTRRVKRYLVGSIHAACPGRGKKGIGHIIILACDEEHFVGEKAPRAPGQSVESALAAEAKREGFKAWQGILDWLKAHGIKPRYRVEFYFTPIRDRKLIERLYHDKLPEIKGAAWAEV